MRISPETLGRFAEWAVLGLLLFAVLFRGGKSLEATWVLTGVAGCVTLLSWALHRTEQKKIPDRVWAAAILFVLWTFLSFVLSTTKNYGLDEVLRDASLVLLFFWMARHATQSSGPIPFVQRFLYTVLIATVFACVVGSFVYVLQPVNRFVGTFVDPRFHTDYWPNAWAQYVLLTWPVFLWFLLRAKDHKQYVLRLAVFGFVLGCFFLSYSRGATIAFAGQLLLLGFIVWRNPLSLTLSRRGERGTKERTQNDTSVVPLSLQGEGRGEGWKKILFAVAFIGAVALSTFLFINSVRDDFYSVQSVTEKVTFTSDEGGSSVSERSQFWGQAVSLALRRPFAGWGPYSFRFVQPSYQESVLATSDHPHNIFLKYAAERGIPAAVLFIALLVFILLPAFRSFFLMQYPLPPSGHPLPEGEGNLKPGVFAFIGIVGVLSHNLIDFNLQFVGIAVPFWLMLGMMPVSESQTRIPGKIKHSVELFLVVVILLVAVWEGGFLIVSSLGRHAEANGDVDRALVWYERAALEVFSRDMHLSRAQIYASKQNTEGAQSMIDTYFHFNDQDARAWKLQGYIALEARDTPLARRSFEEAYRRNRWNDLWTVTGLLEALNRAKDTQTIGARKKETEVLTL